jgi:hypothetical protein
MNQLLNCRTQLRIFLLVKHDRVFLCCKLSNLALLAHCRD